MGFFSEAGFFLPEAFPSEGWPVLFGIVGGGSLLTAPCVTAAWDERVSAMLSGRVFEVFLEIIK